MRTYVRVHVCTRVATCLIGARDRERVRVCMFLLVASLNFSIQTTKPQLKCFTFYYDVCERTFWYLQQCLNYFYLNINCFHILNVFYDLRLSKGRQQIKFRYCNMVAR